MLEKNFTLWQFNLKGKEFDLLLLLKKKEDVYKLFRKGIYLNKYFHKFIQEKGNFILTFIKKENLSNFTLKIILSKRGFYLT